MKKWIFYAVISSTIVFLSMSILMAYNDNNVEEISIDSENDEIKLYLDRNQNYFYLQTSKRDYNLFNALRLILFQGDDYLYMIQNS